MGTLHTAASTSSIEASALLTTDHEDLNQTRVSLSCPGVSRHFASGGHQDAIYPLEGALLVAAHGGLVLPTWALLQERQERHDPHHRWCWRDRQPDGAEMWSVLLLTRPV